MGTIADYHPAFAADQKSRELSMALVEGAEAFQRDAISEPGASSELNRWSWPGPGEMEFQEIGGSKDLRTWDIKVKAARLQNVWRDSLESGASIPFGKDPNLTGWPAEIEGEDGFVRSVDDLGKGLGEYWANAFAQKIFAGIRFTLVDLPAEKGAGAAYFVPIDASQVLEVKTALDGDKLRATEARVLMAGGPSPRVNDDPDKWIVDTGMLLVRIYRVSELVTGDSGGPVHFRTAVKRGTGTHAKWAWATPWEPLVARRGVFTEIPLVPHYTTGNVPYRDRPPFGDTAKQQAAHFRKMLDYDQRCRNDARSQLVVTGAKSSAHVFRKNVVWVEDPQAKPYLLETTGQAIGSLKVDLDSLAQEIRVGNMRPWLSEAPQPNRTATEIKVTEMSAKSRLEMWIKWDMAAFRQALTYKMRLDGLTDPPGEVLMPHSLIHKPEGLLKLWEGYLASGGQLVPPEVIWPDLKTHSWIPDGVDTDAIVQTVKANIANRAEPSAPLPETD